MNSEQLKNIILHSSKPLVLKNIIKWNILHWSLEDWKEQLKNEEMEFRTGNFEFSREPQWENHTQTIKGKFDFFLNHITENDPKTWLYFDYKYLNNFLLSATDLRNEITWSPLGFTEATCDDSTIWIGSKGAHTPCHIDTYGFNLVCQIFGRKLWVLFPPDENLKPTRVPYEESSIYSELNFFSPNVKDFQVISNAHIIILDPGDVLYVPHGWWHYVENLDTAISINMWLPSPEDDSKRINEALIQFLVKQVSNCSEMQIMTQILNPNMLQILKDDSKSVIDMIWTTLSIYENNATKQNKKIKETSQGKSNNIEIGESLTSQGCIKEVPKASQKEWIDFLNNKSKRFSRGSDSNDKETNKSKSETVEKTNIAKLLKAFTDPDVISLVQSKLLNSKK